MIINGTVTDPSGHPVAGATVLIVSAPIPVPDIAALTRADGRFSITVPVSGDYRLAVRSEVDLVEVTVRVADGEAQVVVALSG